MKRACLILLAAMMILAFIYCRKSNAMPPHPDREAELAVLKAFGKAVPEYAELMAQRLARGIDTPADIDMQSLLAEADTINVLAILIQFPDKASQTSTEFFDTLIYADQQGCVKHYYLENSYGVMNIGTVTLPSELGWLTAAEDASYYVSGGDYGLGTYPNNCQKLVEEAVDLANSLVDYSLYDNDDDGFVDALIVVHAGRGAEYTMDENDIWSHKWGISPRSMDGVYISSYSMMPEYYSTAGDMTCGVYCHELGHVFGLPDLYDRDYTSRGVGRWSVMATGSWNGYSGSSPAHFDAWSKIQLGFASAININNTTMGASLPQVETNQVIYRLWTNGAEGDQYFLVENRQQTGYDSYLPGEGLLIWHIDEAMGAGSDSPDNDNEWYPPDHTGSGHYLVALEQADGLWQLEQKTSYGDAADPFPGDSNNSAFSPLTVPNSNDYADDNTLVGITNISSSSATMSADFTVSFASHANEDGDETLPLVYTLGQNMPNPFNTETSISFSIARAGQVDLEIYNIAGQKVTGLTSGFYNAGTYTVNWNGTNSAGQETASGLYFYRLQSGDGIMCRKMMLLK